MNNELQQSEEQPCFIGSDADAPSYMCHNKHIKKGYRINFNTYWKLLKSLFMIHNETINVWTHLIGMLIFFILINYSFNKYQPSDFYYSTILNNFNQERFLFADFGIPYQKFKSVKNQFMSNIIDE